MKCAGVVTSRRHGLPAEIPQRELPITSLLHAIGAAEAAYADSYQLESQTLLSGDTPCPPWSIDPTKMDLVLTEHIEFSPERDAEAFAAVPAGPAVFLLRGEMPIAEPYVSKTANLRRRLQRLLGPIAERTQESSICAIAFE